MALILRGPALGVPLWLPGHVLPCSKCLKLKLAPADFDKRDNLRIEPVCIDCKIKESHGG